MSGVLIGSSLLKGYKYHVSLGGMLVVSADRGHCVKFEMIDDQGFEWLRESNDMLYVLAVWSYNAVSSYGVRGGP